MEDLKINGYTVIASIRKWEEYTVWRDEYGDVRPLYFRNGQDDIGGNEIEEWTFEGGEYSIDEYAFPTFEELEQFINTLEPAEGQS